MSSSENKKQIISCSRRTDIPAFHYRWLQKVLNDGFVIWPNLYNNKDYEIKIKPEEVHSIVLWSRNYRNLLKDPGKLQEYNLYFQFTLNAYDKVLEPHCPSEEEALNQFREIADRYGVECINWRYDPLLFIKGGNPVEERLETFERLASQMSRIGISRCTVSYTTFYPVVEKRLAAAGLEYFDFEDDFKVHFSERLSDLAMEYGIQLYSCCTPILEKNPSILKGSCIDAGELERVFGGRLSHAKDRGQRDGCGCSKSRDIGSYTQKCSYQCLYCYATPFQI